MAVWRRGGVEAAEAAAEEAAAVELTASLLGAPLSWSSESEEVICLLQ